MTETSTQAQTCPHCGGDGWIWTVNKNYPDGAWKPCSCQEETLQRQRSEKLLAESGVTLDQLRRWRFETFDVARAVADARGKRILADIVADLRAYAAAPKEAEKPWRVLQGPYGCGKTHLAYAVAATRAREHKPVYVGNVPDLLDTLRRGFDNGDYARRLDTIREVEMLVLDDLGVESGTAFAAEAIYRIVDYRYRNRLPLIVTTNAIIQRDGSLAGRVASRLQDAAISVVHTLPAGDFRRAAHN